MSKLKKQIRHRSHADFLARHPEIPMANKIHLRPIRELIPYANNPRKHTKKQIGQIAASIREFRFITPIISDAKDVIIAGHGRYEAAKLLGLRLVPVLLIDHLTEAQVRAYRIADNRIAENAEEDEELMGVELVALSAMNLDFDLEITGFSTAEIDLRIESYAGAAGEDPADACPDADVDRPPITQKKDIWQLGPHRITCADARDPEIYKPLLQGEYAQMVITDPPYNVPIKGNVSGSGRIQHDDFLMGSGEMSISEFTTFLRMVFGHSSQNSVAGSIHFIFMDWRHLGEVLAAGSDIYSALKNVCVWVKDNGGMGSFYRSQHEHVFVFQSGDGTPINNFGLGGDGRYRTNVWSYAGVNTFRPGRMDELAMHPTVKPVALVADAIKDCSKRNGVILDPFGGSGTTLIAAEKTGRIARIIELDPKYVDVTIRRWQAFTGLSAENFATGCKFNDLDRSQREEADNE